mmetsp:Transcript_4340/g.11256  ORF Transcript_4340/g.11256 Transcript_4340/m.11256 type:complete len:217 (+) Transcript_4340:52-702(+)
MVEVFSTRVGRVTLKALGVRHSQNVPTFVALGALGHRGCGPHWEATGIASRLSETHRVLLPDPYSNSQAAPSAGEFAVLLTLTTFGGLRQRPTREEWLLDLLPTDGGPVVLAGHSWGGGAVARLAAKHPEAVSRLVLISPDVEWSVARRCWSIPTLLIWARDDMVNPIIWMSRWAGHPNITVHITPRGGHSMLEEHGEVIASWLGALDDKEKASSS